MNRSLYYNYIDDKLGTLAHRINVRGKLNILDFHCHSENFYSDFINTLFGWNSSNLNAIKQNVEAIDLIDNINKLIIQVSATCTKQKINNSLTKEIFSNYPSYRLKSIFISQDASELRKHTYSAPKGIEFDPNKDICDNRSLLESVLLLKIDDQKRVYEFIKKELGGPTDIVKLDSNLAAIINILSGEPLDQSDSSKNNQFQIDNKISHNKLQAARAAIDEYAKYHGRLDKLYSNFDILGVNKSLSVLQAIQMCYIKEKAKSIDSDQIFFAVLDSLKEKVTNSANFSPIPIDELELCVNIIAVDAFIRCKIFENPVGYTHAIT